MIDLPTGPSAVSLRQRIMSVLLARFEAQQRGVDGAIMSWDVVTDKPMSASQQTAGYSIGIYDTSEKKKDLTGRVECFLNVVFEFHAQIAEGDDLAKTLRAILGEVQRVALMDLNNKEPDGYQLSVDMTEKGNELENMSEAATKGAGVLVVEVRYHHRPGQPWRR